MDYLRSLQSRAEEISASLEQVRREGGGEWKEALARFGALSKQIHALHEELHGASEGRRQAEQFYFQPLVEAYDPGPQLRTKKILEIEDRERAVLAEARRRRQDGGGDDQAGLPAAQVRLDAYNRMVARAAEAADEMAAELPAVPVGVAAAEKAAERPGAEADADAVRRAVAALHLPRPEQ